MKPLTSASRAGGDAIGEAKDAGERSGGCAPGRCGEQWRSRSRCVGINARQGHEKGSEDSKDGCPLDTGGGVSFDGFHSNTTDYSVADEVDVM
jgi:hypothetical protein